MLFRSHPFRDGDDEDDEGDGGEDDEGKEVAPVEGEDETGDEGDDVLDEEADRLRSCDASVVRLSANVQRQRGEGRAKPRNTHLVNRPINPPAP